MTTEELIKRNRNMKFNIRFRSMNSPALIGDPVIYKDQTEFTFEEAVKIAVEMNNECDVYYHWVEDTIEQK